MNKVSSYAQSALNTSMSVEDLATEISKVSRNNDPMHSKVGIDAGNREKVYVRKQTKPERFLNLIITQKQRIKQHADLLNLIKTVLDASLKPEQSETVLKNIKSAIGSGNVRSIPDLLRQIDANENADQNVQDQSAASDNKNVWEERKNRLTPAFLKPKPEHKPLDVSGTLAE